MRLIESIHGAFIVDRRASVLAGLLCDLIPQEQHLLDVGCGDGALAYRIQEARTDLEIVGVDVIERESTKIPVDQFDGTTLPFDDNSFDGAMLVDVLHHTDDPAALLREARRVVRSFVVIKDHLRDGFLAQQTLEFMDRVGNERFGVPLPFNYLSKKEWNDLFDSTELTVNDRKERLALYPFPLSVAFNRNLHFVARVSV